MALIETLPECVSPETAHIVADYPYGFRLRCKIRYWLEYRKNYGFRFCSQTTNPKKPGEIWNKPKTSTYYPLAVMGIEEGTGHVSWEGCTHYRTKEEFSDFLTKYGKRFSDIQKIAAASLSKDILSYGTGVRYVIDPSEEIRVI